MRNLPTCARKCAADIAASHRRRRTRRSLRNQLPTRARNRGTDRLSSPGARRPQKFVLGPPVETPPPVAVFTGPADRPDTVEQIASATPKKKKKASAHKTEE